MGMVQLRYYQKDASESAVEAFKKYKNPFLLHLPTGAGKSYVIADIVKSLNEPVLILQPSLEILQQNYAKMVLAGMEDIGIFSASAKKRSIGKITLATIGSIKKYTNVFSDYNYVIIDEAHVVNSIKKTSMYMKFLKNLGKVKVCGLTASPYRLVSRSIESLGPFPEEETQVKALTRQWPSYFKKIVYTISHGQLVKEDYLKEAVYHKDNLINFNDLRVNSKGSDYTLDSMAILWGESNINRSVYVIAQIDEQVTASLSFCVSIAQAELISKKLNNIGISADYISSLDKKKERKSKLEKFNSGELKHLLNVGVMTTGVDLPFLDTVIYIRPTLSLSLYYQMGGRVSRLDPDNPDKIAKIIDLVGNVERFGRIETITMGKDGYKDIVISEKGVLSDRPLI